MMYTLSFCVFFSCSESLGHIGKPGDSSCPTLLKANLCQGEILQRSTVPLYIVKQRCCQLFVELVRHFETFYVFMEAKEQKKQRSCHFR